MSNVAEPGRLFQPRAFRSLGSLGESQLARPTYQRDDGSADMSKLALHLELAPSSLSAHVGHLEAEGLVTMEKQGKRRIVTVVPEVITVGLEAV